MIEIAHDVAIILGNDVYMNAGLAFELRKQFVFVNALRSHSSPARRRVTDCCAKIREEKRKSSTHQRGKVLIIIIKIKPELSSFRLAQVRYAGSACCLSYFLIELLENQRNFTGASLGLILECVIDWSGRIM